MKVIKDYLKTSDHHEIYYEMYEPTQPRKHVHILHGMAEHIGRYQEFARFLAKRGFVVTGHDHRGHGRTAERNGTQGFFSEHNGFEQVVKDAEEVIKKVRTHFDDLPMVLLGHSMGSFIARRYIQLNSKSEELCRVVLSGTGGNPGIEGKAGLALASLLSKVKGKKVQSPLLGALTVGGFIKDFKDEGSKFAWLTSDREEVKKYEHDSMSGFASSNQFYVDLLKGLFLIHKKEEVNKIRKDLPVLLISGAQDPVGDYGKGVFSAAKQYQQAGMTDVTVYLAEGGRHELLHEKNKYRHFQTFADWMAKNG